MKNKVLILVYVPSIEENYDIYIPENKKIGSVKNLIIDIIEEQSEGIFINDGCKNLYDKLTGEKLDDQLYVKNNIKNGTKIILY